jgi:hypothetical protein
MADFATFVGTGAPIVGLASSLVPTRFWVDTAVMLQRLAELAEKGRLQNFTELADAVMRIDDTLEHVDDKRALYRVARLLDGVFGQAYRGEKSMAYLADRVNSVAEVLDLMSMEEPEVRDQPDPDGQQDTEGQQDSAGQPGGEGEQDATDSQDKPANPFVWDAMWQAPDTTTK